VELFLGGEKRRRSAEPKLKDGQESALWSTLIDHCVLLHGKVPLYDGILAINLKLRKGRQL